MLYRYSPSGSDTLLSTEVLIEGSDRELVLYLETALSDCLAKVAATLPSARPDSTGAPILKRD